MKKYIPLCLLAGFIFCMLGWGHYALAQKERAAKQATYAAAEHLLVYSDLPDSVNRGMAGAFYQRTGLSVQIQTMSDRKLQETVTDMGGQEKPDLIIAAEQVLRNVGSKGLLRTCSVTGAERVLPSFKDRKNRWLGLWYNPMVFAVSADYYKQYGHTLQGWQDIVKQTNCRILFPDLAATDMAGDFLCTLVEMQGRDNTAAYLRRIQQQRISYAKTWAINVRRVAGGEVDLAVVDESNAAQYQAEGAPLVIVYPREGTSYWLTGIGITVWNHESEIAASFVEWLLSPDVTRVLQQQQVFVEYTTTPHPYRSDAAGKRLVLFPVKKEYTDEGRSVLQDWWLRTVRFGRDR